MDVYCINKVTERERGRIKCIALEILILVSVLIYFAEHTLLPSAQTSAGLFIGWLWVQNKLSYIETSGIKKILIKLQ